MSMKSIFSIAAASLLLSFASFAAAQQADCCAEKAKAPKAKAAAHPKVQATADECKDCDAAGKAPKAKAAAHPKVQATADECQDCDAAAKTAKAPKAKAAAHPKVQATAHADECQDCDEMAKTAKAEDECCKSTAAKPMKVGDPGCCNNANEIAKFKLFVVGRGYAYFGCEGSAGKARMALVKKGEFVGSVQKVASKVKIGKGVKV